MGGEKSLKDLINSMMDSYHLSDKLVETRLRKEWEALMGRTIAKNTTRLSIHRKTLYLELLSAPLKNDLYFHEKTIVEKVNQHIGQRVIEKIKIK
ncbi:MAG: hypothetical protein ACI9JN_002498 [Bacteroidia bacterium]|jgi:hypothetical protein